MRMPVRTFGEHWPITAATSAEYFLPVLGGFMPGDVSAAIRGLFMWPDSWHASCRRIQAKVTSRPQPLGRSGVVLHA